MDRHVAITGAGLISPLGDSPRVVFEALCKGTSGIRQQFEPFGVDGYGCGCHLAAQLHDFRSEKYLLGRPLRPLDRISQVATAACGLALKSSEWNAESRAATDLSLVLGTMFGGMHTIGEFDRTAIVSGPASVSPMAFANTVINAAAGQTAIWHNLRGANSTVATGSISGISAVGHAADLILHGRSAVVLAGGADEFSVESFWGFARAGLLCTDGHRAELPIPFDERRNGFAIGEGAGVLVMEELAQANRRGATAFAEVRGYASAFDPSQGKDLNQAVSAAVRAMRTAIHRSGMGVGDIDFVSASANGSIAQDCYELSALAQTFGERVRELPVTAIKCGTGETLGASGPLQIAVAIETLESGKLPGIIGLEKLPPGCPLQGVLAQTRPINAHRAALINGVGLEGNYCSLVIATLE
jgi:3-oxoacyl-[acyl-carrier-protein] synthase II